MVENTTEWAELGTKELGSALPECTLFFKLTNISIFKQVAFVENAESTTMGKETGLGVMALAAVCTTSSVLELVHSLQMHGNGSVGSILSSHCSTG